MKKVFIIVIWCFILLIGYSGFAFINHSRIYYPKETIYSNYKERQEKEYEGNIENIESDGFVNPLIYSISRERLDYFIDSDFEIVIKGFESAEDIKDSIYTYKINENGYINELMLSAKPCKISEDIQFNIGQFKIDRNFLKFYSNENMEKILQKNNVDEQIENIYLIVPTFSSDNISTIIALIKCNKNNYFITWDKCWSSVGRFENRAMKSYFQSDDYNYITFYKYNDFCEEFSIKKGSLYINSEKIMCDNCYINHDCGIFPLFKAIPEEKGLEKIDELNYIFNKENGDYKLSFSRNSESGNVYSLNIYDENGKKLNQRINCYYEKGEYLIKDENYYKIKRIIGKNVVVDYENGEINIMK